MYVDGILAENHGGEPARVRPAAVGAARDHGHRLRRAALLAGARRRYRDGGTHLAYLDVWQREVTHDRGSGPRRAGGRRRHDRPHPDGLAGAAASRRHGGVDVHHAGRRHPGMERGHRAVGRPAHRRDDRGRRRRRPLRAAADRRLPRARAPDLPRRGARRRRARAPPPSSGRATTARSSRPVLEVLAGGVGVRPASLGRDDVLGFARRRLGRDHRRPPRARPHARRAPPHRGRRGGRHASSFAGAPLPVDLQLDRRRGTARHLRVRRWDQSGKVKDAGGAVLVDLDLAAATGAITVPASPATQVVLEHGLVVSFDTTGAAVPHRRPLDRPGARSRRVGGTSTSRRSAAPRRSASTITTRGSASSRSPTARPTAALPGPTASATGRLQRLHGLRDARVARVGHAHDPGGRRPGHASSAAARCASPSASTGSRTTACSSSPGCRSDFAVRASGRSCSPPATASWCARAPSSPSRT